MRTILIVMHNQIIGSMIKRILEEEDYICHYVQKTQDAFIVLEKQHFDLLIFQATNETSDFFIETCQTIQSNLPILTATFSKREKIIELTNRTGIAPIQIPFSEQQIKENVHNLFVSKK